MWRTCFISQWLQCVNMCVARQMYNCDHETLHAPKRILASTLSTHCLKIAQLPCNKDVYPSASRNRDTCVFFQCVVGPIVSGSSRLDIDSAGLIGRLPGVGLDSFFPFNWSDGCVHLLSVRSKVSVVFSGATTAQVQSLRSKPTLAKPTLAIFIRPTLAKPTLAKVKVLVVCEDFGFLELIVWVF